MKKWAFLLLAAFCLLLAGCSMSPSSFPMLHIDLSGEEKLQAVRYHKDGTQQPLPEADALYAAVKAQLANAKIAKKDGGMKDELRLYFYPESKADFRQQFFIFTPDEIVYVSYNPFYNMMERFQLPEGTYATIKQLIE